MKNKYYNIFSFALLIICILLFVVFILSSILIFINRPYLSWQFNNIGFQNFLNIYSPSLQIGTASIIVLTLWLTVKRMQQTQRQLEITYENVNFNNYYKHKEMFTQLMTGLSFYSTIKKYSQINVDELIPAVYSYFYNSSYKDFQPRLNDKAKEEVVNFIQEIKNSKLNSKDQDLKEIDIEEIEKLSRLVNRTIEPLCIINAEIEILTVRKYYKTAEDVSIKLVEERFKLINNLYWTISLYESFIAFDGIHQSERSTFLLNFTKYLSDIGLG